MLVLAAQGDRMKMTLGQAMMKKGGFNKASAMQPKGMASQRRTLVKRKPVRIKRAK